MKKHGTILLISFVVLMFAVSFVSASSISSATYDGNGLYSLLGGARPQPGSDITHNSSFTSTIEINISDCKDKLANFSDASGIKSIEVSLKDSSSNTATLKNESITVDSASVDGDIMRITINGGEEQHYTGNGGLNSLFDYDHANVTKVNIDTGAYKISANA